MKTMKAPILSSFKIFCNRFSHHRKNTVLEHAGLKDIPRRSSSSSSEDLQAVFDYLDANRDGRISPEELQKSFETLGSQLSDEEAEAAVRLSDTDGDGMLDFEEFVKLMKGDENDNDDVGECKEDEKINELKEAFRLYSCEGKEYITPKSLRKMLRKLGESRTLDDCKAMICAFDLNADGVLNFDEFVLMMR